MIISLLYKVFYIGISILYKELVCFIQYKLFSYIFIYQYIELLIYKYLNVSVKKTKFKFMHTFS